MKLLEVESKLREIVESLDKLCVLLCDEDASVSLETVADVQAVRYRLEAARERELASIRRVSGHYTSQVERKREKIRRITLDRLPALN